MKRLNFKATSKKANFEVFAPLSKQDLIMIKGGGDETPPDEVVKEIKK